MLISFLCDYDNKNLYFLTFQDFSWYFSFAHFGYYQNLVIWLYSSNLIFCVCSVALRKNSRWPTNHILLWRAWTASPICFKEAYHMVICWLDFGVILKSHFHVVYGGGGGASFAPHAYLVLFDACIMANISALGTERVTSSNKSNLFFLSPLLIANKVQWHRVHWSDTPIGQLPFHHQGV